MTEPSDQSQKSVTIVGGGIAGMTAAYYLAKNGYAVSLYEREPQLGGALSAVPYPPPGDPDRAAVYYEASPHMFGDWYVNFFAMMEEIGVHKETDPGARRDQSFQFSPSVRFINAPTRQGMAPHYTSLTNNGSIRYGADNLYSGVLSPAGLFLYWYAVVDILDPLRK
jgi:uncharacterized protein with NAD-binding domain and iron-sulfur cluster